MSDTEWTRITGELAQKQAEPPDSLWHYTSVGALVDILRTSTVRLSSLEQMNDSMEGRWVYKKVMEAATIFEPDPVPMFFQRRPSYLNIFVFSLSADGDLLSQWRGYADGGEGVAIEFDSKKLASATPSHLGYKALQKVIYDKQEQESIFFQIREILEKILTDHSARKPQGLVNNDPTSASIYTRSWLRNLSHQAFDAINSKMRQLEPIFKNPTFREENEWRVVYYHGSQLNHEDIKFRARGSEIVPYRELSVAGAIRGVRLGPLCKADCDTMTAFLKSRRIENPQVSRSEASLR